jgi:hypothetical protein
MNYHALLAPLGPFPTLSTVARFLDEPPLVIWRRAHSGEFKAILSTSMVRIQFPSLFEFLKQRQPDEKLLPGPSICKTWNSIRLAFAAGVEKALRIIFWVTGSFATGLASWKNGAPRGLFTTSLLREVTIKNDSRELSQLPNPDQGPVMNESKVEDGLDITRRRWAEEEASGAWEAAARRQAERQRRERKAEKAVHNETEKSHSTT